MENVIKTYLSLIVSCKQKIDMIKCD